MVTAAIGLGMARELGLASAFADEAAERLDFGALEPLVRTMQETPVAKLLPVLAEKLRAGTELRQLVAAGAKGDSSGPLERWGPVRAPSRTPAPGGEVPLPLDGDDLARVPGNRDVEPDRGAVLDDRLAHRGDDDRDPGFLVAHGGQGSG